MMALTNLFILLMATVFLPAGMENKVPVHQNKWVLLKTCKVVVNGFTNISKFTCSAVDYAGNDTITCFTGKTGGKDIAMQGSIALPVWGFDCMNKAMTKDLRKTLKEKEYPFFVIHFLSIDKYPALQAVAENVQGKVSIELAGIRKDLDVCYRISMSGQGAAEIKVTKDIYFSDFNLVPPHKMGGLVRAGNKLNVEFVIHFRVIAS